MIETIRLFLDVLSAFGREFKKAGVKPAFFCPLALNAIWAFGTLLFRPLAGFDPRPGVYGYSPRMCDGPPHRALLIAGAVSGPIPSVVSA
jgi:hypothetical protein